MLTQVRQELHHLRRFLRHRLFGRHIVKQFHRIYYDLGADTWTNTYWLGVPVWKNPMDLWMYQEIIVQTRPDLIIETGTLHGGSALFLATMCDLVGKGRVLTVDIKQRENLPKHDRIEYIVGSSVAPEILARLRGAFKPGDRAMVILDSDHSRDHVLKELRLYGQFVPKDNYLIVEDTNINGHPVDPFFGPGPMEAVHAFLKEDRDFIIDSGKEKCLMTFNPKGYLKKIR